MNLQLHSLNIRYTNQSKLQLEKFFESEVGEFWVAFWYRFWILWFHHRGTIFGMSFLAASRRLSFLLAATRRLSFLAATRRLFFLAATRRLFFLAATRRLSSSVSSWTSCLPMPGIIWERISLLSKIGKLRFCASDWFNDSWLKVELKELLSRGQTHLKLV